MNTIDIQTVKFKTLLRKISNKASINNTHVHGVNIHNILKKWLKNPTTFALIEILPKLNIKIDNNIGKNIIDFCQKNNILIGTRLKLQEKVQVILQSIIKILVVGSNGVGKTSLIQKYTSNLIMDNSYLMKKEELSNGSHVFLQIYEVSEIKPNSADAIIICYDKHNSKTFTDYIKWRKQIKQNTPDAFVVVLGCKSDKGYNDRKMEEKNANKIMDDPGWKQLNTKAAECSALKNMNIRGTFLMIAECVAKKKYIIGFGSATNVFDDKKYHYDHKMDVILIGDSGVGKTSLMKSFGEYTFNGNESSTISVDQLIQTVKLHDNSVMKITVWDTAGQERHQSMCRTYYRRADVILLCYDVSNKGSLDNVEKWREQIDEYADSDHVIVQFVGCKSDAQVQSKIDVLSVIRRNGSGNNWRKYNLINVKNIQCSAKTGQNVSNVFITASEMVLKRRKEYTSRTPTPGSVLDDYTKSKENNDQETPCCL